MAVSTKLLITKVNLSTTVNAIVAKTVLSNDEAGVKVGFMFVETLVNEVFMNSHIIGYFNYTITIAEFTRQVIDRLFDATFTVCCLTIERFFQGPSENLVIIIESGLKALYALLSYPFENSYISFSTDQDLSDPSITIIPFEWANKLKEPAFFGYLQALSSSNLYPPNSSLRLAAITLASKFSSCKIDAVMSAVETAPLLKSVMLYTSHVMEYYERLDKLPTDEIMEQLLDQIHRLFKLYRVMKLSKHKDEFKRLMQLLVGLSKIVYINYTDLDNKIFQTTMSIWSVIIDQCSYVEFTLAEYFEATYIHYAEIYLYPESQKSISLTIPETVSSDNFDKVMQKKYKSFKDLFTMQKEVLFPVLEKIIKGICSDTQVTCNHPENSELRKGWITEHEDYLAAVCEPAGHFHYVHGLQVVRHELLDRLPSLPESAK